MKNHGNVRPARLILSALLIGIVVVIVGGNLSDTGLQGSLKTATQPFRTITGLNQNWDVFASPRTFSQFVDGRVDFADGTSTTYSITTRPGLGAYVDYRWQKYEERLGADDDGVLVSRYARYLGDRARAEGRNPKRVTVIRRWSDTLPPGPGPQRGPWHEATMFVLDLG